MLTLIDILLRLASMFFLLRFLVQVVHAQYNQPIVTAINNLTDPVLKPLRSVLPSSRRLDLASLLVTMALQIASVYAAFPHANEELISPAWWWFIWMGVVSTLHLSVWIFLVAILVSAIMSWIAPNVFSPAADLARQFSEPFLAPIRKILPPMAGFDFSPMVGMFILFALNSYVIPVLSSIGS